MLLLYVPHAYAQIASGKKNLNNAYPRKTEENVANDETIDKQVSFWTRTLIC